MDKKNVLIAVPTPEQVSMKFVHSLIGIIAFSKKLSDQVNLDFQYQTGVRTDANRNQLLQRALENDIDFILWLDADMTYPPDILARYIPAMQTFDIVGCLYFKRKHPFEPVGYKRSKGKAGFQPFNPLELNKLPDNAIVEAAGLGFGGMMVKTDLYRKMGDDKWMHYCDNFHIPGDKEGPTTHDLVFCQTASKYGARIGLHNGVRPGHIAEYVISDIDCIRANELQINHAQFSNNWFGAHIPNWNKYLKPLHQAQELNFLEIGCYEGRATLWMLEQFPQSQVTVIDPFDGSGYLPAVDLKKRFMTNTAPYASRLTIIQGKSQDKLPELSADSFDLIYIDGAHDYESVVKDASQAFRVCKRDGYIIFDDYLWDRFNNKHNRPKPAIDEFLQSYDVRVLHKGGQVFAQKL